MMDLAALAKTIDNTLRYLAPADLGESLHHDMGADQWLALRRWLMNDDPAYVRVAIHSDAAVTIQVVSERLVKHAYITTLLPGDFTQTLLQRHVEYGMKQVIPNFTSAFAQD